MELAKYLDSESLDNLVKRNIETGWLDLPPEGKAFAHEYIMDYNHRAAAERIGKSPNAGLRLLREPLTASYIAYVQELQRTSSVITKDFIHSHLLQLLSMAKGEEDVHAMLPDGTEVNVRKTNVGEATNILKELAKSIEYEKDTGTKTAPVSITINTGSFYDDTDVPSIIIEGEKVE